MSRRFFVGVSAVLALVFLMVLSAVPVLAFDARGATTVAVSGDETVDDDLYAAGNAVVIDGRVDGELWAVGNMITVNGTVAGSTMAAGRTVHVGGGVGHALRAAGEVVTVSGNVDGDLLVGCGELNVASTAKIGGDVLFGAGTARIDGLVGGDVKGAGGDVTISGQVEGDVHLDVDSLTLSPTAVIHGDLTYTSEEEAVIQAGAEIAGTITREVPEVEEEQAKAFPFAFFSGIGAKVLGFLMALVAGLVIILLAPQRLASAAESIRTRPGSSVGWGALILFATPIAAIVVCITIVGIPVGLITLVLWGVAIYLAQIPVGLFLGRCIIGRFRSVEGKAIMVGALALGLVILKLLGLIPHLGFFVGLAVVLFGLGAVVVAERRRRAEARETAPG